MQMNGESSQSPTPDSDHVIWSKPEDGLASPIIKTSTTTATKDDDNKFTVQVITKYMCRYCARQFDSPAEMQAHISTHARGKSSTHSCYVCGKTYSTPSKLQRHVRVHSGERPYACNICGRRFTRSDHVKQHLKVHMPQKQRNSCRICGMKFLRRQTLHAHLQQDHSIIQVFTCHRCGEAFDCIEKLHTHKDAHLSIYPQNNVEEIEGGIVIKKEPGAPPDDHKGENPIIGLAKFSLGPQPTLVEEAQHTLSQQRKAVARSLRMEPKPPTLKMETNGVANLTTDEETAMEEMIKNALAEARQLEAETMNSDDFQEHKSGTTVTDGTQMFILPSKIKQERIDEDEMENNSGEVNGEKQGNSSMEDEDHNKGCQTMCDDEDDDSDEEEDERTQNTENNTEEKMVEDQNQDNGEPNADNALEIAKQEIKIEPISPGGEPSADASSSQAPVPKMKIKLLGPASYKAAMKNKLQLQSINALGGGSKIIGTLTPVPTISSPSNTNLSRLISSARPVWGMPTGVSSTTSSAPITPVATTSTVSSSSTTSQPQTKKLTRCEHCCIWFEDYTMSLLHNSLHSADETDPFTCRKCLKKLGNRLEFTAHLVWHLEPNMDC